MGPIGLIGITGLLALTAACASSAARDSSSSPAASSSASREAQEQTVNHLTPTRDSVGKAPARFTWTGIPGADSYSIGIWNEVDVLVWRQNNIPATSVAVPEDVQLEPGTYFWAVSALREGQQLAESGLAAFVVRTIP
jgi:hypothetical protein